MCLILKFCIPKGWLSENVTLLSISGLLSRVLKFYRSQSESFAVYQQIVWLVLLLCLFYSGKMIFDNFYNSQLKFMGLAFSNKHVQIIFGAKCKIWHQIHFNAFDRKTTQIISHLLFTMNCLLEEKNLERF